jgi:hypothetical protein
MIQSIEDWAEPRSVENVQQFSSFVNLDRVVEGMPVQRVSQSRIGLSLEASRTSRGCYGVLEVPDASVFGF